MPEGRTGADYQNLRRAEPTATPNPTHGNSITLDKSTASAYGSKAQPEASLANNRSHSDIVKMKNMTGYNS